MEIDTTTVQRLMEIGYLAAGGGMTADAENIFDAVQAARPDSELPRIGQAVARLNAGQPHDAAQTLRAALETHPQSDLARAFLGLALRQAGMNAEAETVLREVAGESRQSEAAALAQSLLEQ